MNKFVLQPIDKFSLSLILACSLIIVGLVWSGNACEETCLFRSNPRVKEFTWKNQELGVEDTAFLMTFNRPMDSKSVEENLVINPPLPGKISWAGRRLAFTLETPIPYGVNYQIDLQGARERFREGQQMGQEIEPFSSEFNSRDRAFAYIGTLPEEQGQLILYNVTRQTKTILTPPNLVVMDFKFYPQGDKILFSAAEKSRGSFGIRELQLYTVETTVKNSEAKKESTFPPINLVLDNREYQNNKFDLSSDGKTIVVQRVNRSNPADFDLWMIKSNGRPERLNSPGGDFLITPDGQAVAVAQGQGISILPLKSDADPLDFLPTFGQVLSFSANGLSAAMVNFNMDNASKRYTRSLYYVNNQGVQKELLNIQGSIVDCKFSPKGDNLYCLLTQLLEEEEDYIEQPYFVRINIRTEEVTPLVSLPDYRDIAISLAPDGLGLLFDQVITTYDDSLDTPLTTDSGESIIGSRLWLLIPSHDSQRQGSKPDLQELPLVGFRPRWAP